MAWLRLYDDILADPKILLLGPELFQTWVFYLAAYKKYDGNMPDRQQIACLLRLTEDKLDEHLSRLVKARLCDEDGDIIRPHNWDKFQYKSDVSSERVKRHRNADAPLLKRQQTVTETANDRFSNGQMALLKQEHAVTVTPSETETDTETESDVAAVAATRAVPPPPTRQQQQPEFPSFGDEPDPTALVSEAVEEVAQFWPMLGNVPNAKRVWERHAVESVEGVSEWCRKIRQTALVHSVAHEQCRKSNQRHFIPTLEKWVYDRDYSRPAPRVLDGTVQAGKKSNLDIAKEMLGIQEKNHAH